MQVPRSVLPPALQLLQWVFSPLEYMEIYSQRFGDMFRVETSPVNPEPYVLVNHPQALQYIFSHENSDHLSAPGSVNLLAKPLLGEYSLILADGQAHRQRRQLLLPPFHGEALKSYRQHITQITAEVWAKVTPASQFCVRELAQKITMRVILQVVFGLYQGERYHQLERLLTERLDLISSPLTSLCIFFPQLLVDLGDWSLAGRLKALSAQARSLIYAEIQERRANLDPSRTDILSILLQARDPQGQPLTDIELHDELITLLIAGHETTATSLAWAFYWIHHQPQVEQSLRAELDSKSGEGSQSPYLHAVCQETLRLYPIGLTLLPRRVEKPFTLLGYNLEPGMLLLGSVYLIHHRSDLYPQPKQFRPERFLERQYNVYEFLPFGGGNRRCIGAALAMMEMQEVIATILQTSRLQLVQPQTVKPERRGGTLAPSGGVWMRRLT
jgi:cytochrome P450 family 110